MQIIVDGDGIFLSYLLLRLTFLTTYTNVFYTLACSVQAESATAAPTSKRAADRRTETKSSSLRSRQGDERHQGAFNDIAIKSSSHSLGSDENFKIVLYISLQLHTFTFRNFFPTNSTWKIVSLRK